MATSNMHKNWWSGRTVFELCEQTNRQMHRQTDILITILRNPTMMK